MTLFMFHFFSLLEPDARDDGEESKRELVALGGALLIASNIPILVPRHRHRLVGGDVAHTVPAKTDAEMMRQQQVKSHLVGECDPFVGFGLDKVHVAVVEPHTDMCRKAFFICRKIVVCGTFFQQLVRIDPICASTIVEQN